MYACYTPNPNPKSEKSIIDFIFGKVGFHTFLKFERDNNIVGIDHWLTNGFFVQSHVQVTQSITPICWYGYFSASSVELVTCLTTPNLDCSSNEPWHYASTRKDKYIGFLEYIDSLLVLTTTVYLYSITGH